MTPDNTSKKTGDRRFKPGRSGNPSGRPKGSRNRQIKTLEALLDGEAAEITSVCIEKAKGGDMTALRLCLERILPVRKGCPVVFKMPKLEQPKDIATAHSELLNSVAVGDLTPEEGAIVSGLLENRRKALETIELEARLSKLEENRK